MDYLGLFCLGVFVGTIATFGLRRVASIKDWQTVLGFTLPAVLSGAAMVFIDRFKYSPAFGAYPLGLVCALMWAYTTVSVDNIKNGPPLIRWLAITHLLVAGLLTLAGACVATYPAFLQLSAEREVSMADRVNELALSRAAAREPARPASSPARAGSASAPGPGK